MDPIRRQPMMEEGKPRRAMVWGSKEKSRRRRSMIKAAKSSLAELCGDVRGPKCRKSKANDELPSAV